MSRSKKTQALPCAKCDHVNPSESNTCEACGSHLWVSCHDCGHRNVRAEARCVECGGRLHRAWWKRVSKWFVPERKRFALWHAGLLAAGVWLAFKVIVYLAEFRLPTIP